MDAPEDNQESQNQADAEQQTKVPQGNQPEAPAAADKPDPEAGGPGDGDHAKPQADDKKTPPVPNISDSDALRRDACGALGHLDKLLRSNISPFDRVLIQDAQSILNRLQLLRPNGQAQGT